MPEAILALGHRSLIVQFRRAQLVMPTFVLPLMLMAVITSGTGVARDLPGYPDVDSYLSFIVAGTVIQGALLAGLTTGIALASDIESGFFDRLLAAPVPRVALVLGRLSGTVVLGLMQATFFFGIALIFGASYPGGPVAVAGAIVLAALTAAGIGGLAAAIALRTGSLSLMQSIFPFVFVLLFTAPAFFPRALLTPVLHDVAAYNPLTFVVEGSRGLLSGNTALGDPWLALLSAVAMVVFTTLLAVLALDNRLRRL